MDFILVTGGAGFIGIHTTILLIERGYNVIIIDSLITNSKKGIDKLSKNYIIKNGISKSRLKFMRGDLRNINFLRDIFMKEIKLGNRINCVIHFAGLKSVKESIEYPDRYWDINVNGTISLLKVMSENNCCNFVFSSSATVYSFNELSPLNEKSKLGPNNPYGETKLAVENILKDLKKNSEKSWKIICLRYFNPIGAHPSGDFGEFPLNTPNNLFPYLCQVADCSRDKLYIFGKDWPTKDGTCIRDYIHIMDLAEGHISAMQYIEKKENEFFEVINLGTGFGTSVLDLVKTFENANNLEIKYEFTHRRKGDKAIVFADPTLATSILNWKPKKNLVDMCRDGWNWQLKNPKGY